MKKLKFTFEGKTFYADMETDRAPKTCAAVEAACPFRSILLSAKVCHNEAVFRAPPSCLADEVENPVFSTPGDIVFWGIRQVICIFYDDMVALNTSNRFAVMTPEDTKRFALEGQRIWEHPGIPVEVDVVELDENGEEAARNG